jgi:three-Cys-motif partner protein
MTRNRDHFSEFEPHTILKHLVLEAYLVMWARKLLLRPGAGDILYVIDACAGAGMDDIGNHGSPIRAARLAAQVRGQMKDQFDREVVVKVIAIEPHAGRYRQLRTNLEPFGPTVHVLRGTLAEHIDSLLIEIGSAPTLWFIDPYGLAPIDAQLLARALQGPHNEVLALFADEGAIRHFGAVAAELPDIEGEVARRTEQGNLFDTPDEAIARTEQIRREVELSATALTVTKTRAAEILTTALGSERWRETIEAAPPSERRDQFVKLFEECLRERGAGYVLPFAVRNEKRRVAYQLVHASKSPHGFTTMKEAIREALGKAPVSEAAAEQMRFDQRSRLSTLELLQWVLRQFEGKEIAWTDEKGGPLGVKTVVLRETLAFPGDELDDLKIALERYRLTGRRLLYRFPLASTVR